MEKAMNGKCMDPMQEDLLGSQRLKKPAFFACYLLCSLSSRYKGCTYIGQTVLLRLWLCILNLLFGVLFLKLVCLSVVSFHSETLSTGGYLNNQLNFSKGLWTSSA
eukprot:Gb_39041 [translate_table: standard]